MLDGGKASPIKSSSHTDRLIKPNMDGKVFNSHVVSLGENFQFLGVSACETFLFAFKLGEHVSAKWTRVEGENGVTI